MANTIQGIRSLPLSDLLGTTLAAIVKADAEAAKATLEFIEAVGFVQDDGDEKVSRLRMAEFQYEKLDQNDEVSKFVVSVPLLSLLPIPSIHVQEAKLAFSAKITEIAKEAKAPSEPQVSKRLPTARYHLYAKPTASSGARDQEVRGTFHVEIEVSLAQADMPLGLERLFDMMDQAIRDEKAPEDE
jgi:hypothetical protein